MRNYQIAREPWSAAFWTEMRPLAEAHAAEVDGGVEPKRPFRVDQRLMFALQDAGALRVFSARNDGSLLGYFTWNVLPDVESEGLRIAQQGAWYCAPGHPRAAFDLYHFAVQALKAEGVQCIYPHHRTQGRGAEIGRFFKRQGAKHIQQTYSLWIGD